MDNVKDPQEDETSFYSRQFSANGREIMKEGWGEKESGQKILGHYNWRRRWFSLTAKKHIILFSYYVKPADSSPKGEIMLTQEYTARELEMGEKSKPNCFALGPLTDSSALRTYYVSCASEEDKIDWITTLNCVIEGVPEKILKRKSTYRTQSSRKNVGHRVTYPPPELSSKGDTFSYQQLKWRIKQWKILCNEVENGNWKKLETKNGVTIARQSFKNNDLVVLKVETVLEVRKQLLFEYLQRSVGPGGKFDFMFRGETLLQKIEEYQAVTEVVRNDYDVPLPGMKRRDACLAKMWLPDYITRDGTSGILVMSVKHPKSKPSKDLERVFLDVSGVVLYDHEGTDGEMSTRVVVVVQIDLQSALQNMLRSAIKSGLLKRGIRNGFSYFSSCVTAYKEMLMI